MSYINAIAEMLDVKLEEEFYLYEPLYKSVDNHFRYKLNSCGLFCYNAESDKWGKVPNVLIDIIMGTYEVVKRRWMPLIGEKYYFITNDGEVSCTTFDESDINAYRLRLGNFFRIEGNAKANVEHWMEFISRESNITWRTY